MKIRGDSAKYDIQYTYMYSTVWCRRAARLEFPDF